MPEKQKARSWKDPKTIIAAVSVTVLVTLWNTFATRDRGSTGDTEAVVPTPSAAPQEIVDNICPTPTQTKNLGKRCVAVTSTRSS